MGGEREQPGSTGPKSVPDGVAGMGTPPPPLPAKRASGNGVVAPMVPPMQPPPPTHSPDAPAPVDFDALNAALGESRVEAGAPSTPKPTATTSESGGRSSATYASKRPHAIPSTRAPQRAIDEPAVILSPEISQPLAPTPSAPASGPYRAPLPSGPHDGSIPPSGGHHAFSPPAMPVHAAATPAPFAVATTPIARPRSPTIVLRPRGPSTKQRVFAFMAMSLFVTLCGVSVVLWQHPELVPAAARPYMPNLPAMRKAPATPAAQSTTEPTSEHGTSTVGTTIALPSAPSPVVAPSPSVVVAASALPAASSAPPKKAAHPPAPIGTGSQTRPF